MGNKKSEWYKVVGADVGAFKLMGAWIGFDCLLCFEYDYPHKIKTQRWQGPPSKAIVKAMKMKEGHHKCIGPWIHNLVIERR